MTSEEEFRQALREQAAIMRAIVKRYGKDDNLKLDRAAVEDPPEFKLWLQLSADESELFITVLEGDRISLIEGEDWKV